MIKCVIFDFGDTLVRKNEFFDEQRRAFLEESVKKINEKGNNITYDEIKVALNKTYAYFGQFKYGTVNFGGDWERKLLENLNIKDDKLAEELFDLYVNFRITKCSELFPNVKEVLKQLKEKDLIICVITNSSNNLNKKTAEYFGIDKYFSHFIMSHEFGSVKSELKIFKHLLNEIEKKDGIKITPEECLMVGNNLIEDTAAKKVGMKTVIYTKKIQRKDDPEKIEPDYYIDDLMELIKIIN